MTAELIISLVSLVLSTACSMMTVFVTLKVGTLNNLEAIHKYQKKITPFELNLKDKKWFLDLIDRGEFSNYDENSQTIMKAWYKKICQEEAEKEKIAQEALIQQVKPISRRTGRGTISRVPTLPTGGDIFSSGIPVEVIIPGNDNTVNVKALEEVRNQYSIDDLEVKTIITDSEFKEIELDFDDLLKANLDEINNNK